MNINLNINKDGIKELQKQFNNLTEISKKYAKLGYEKSDHINFRNPENVDEEDFVKKANIKTFIFLLVITLIFITTFIFAFIVDTKLLVKILLGVISLLCGFFTYKSISTKELMIGKAIYKERKRDTSGKRRTYLYFVTIIDEERKLIHSRIQISKTEFDIVEEGTPILVSKGTGKGYIYEK